MKKIMIVACVIAFVAVAQAGAVKWSAQNLSAAPGITLGADTTYSAYLFLGDDVSSIKSYLTSNPADLTSFTSKAATSRTASYDTEKGVLSFTATAYGEYSQGDEVTAFMIILDAADAKDAKNFLVAEKNGAATITQTFGKSGDKSFSWGDQSAIAWTQVGNVPEPTSGLLLLLGIAGLALRRRRA